MQAKLENILLHVSLSPEVDGGDLDEAARLIINSAMDGLDAARAGIWLLTQDNSGIECPLLIDRYNGCEQQQLFLARSDYEPYFKALEQERTIRAEDAHTHPATACFSESYLTPLGIGAMLDTPIRYHGRMIGIICCEHIGGTRTWSGDECAFTGALADLYGRALAARQSLEYRGQLEVANSELEQRVKERTAELETSLENLKAMQDKLIEAEKMASLGNLVAGIAHEVNTPLGIAMTSNSSAQEDIKLLSTELEQEKITRQSLADGLSHVGECLSLTFANLERAAGLIANFKKTAVDQSSLHLSEIVVCDYIDSVIHSLSPVTKAAKVKVSIECTEKLKVTTFPGVLSQIIMNLVNNSCMHGFRDREGNCIDIRVSKDSVHDQYYIEYKDNGLGMKEEVLKRVFEPFFTTARNQGGSGLGMSIVYNLATQALHGEITLTSEPGQGVMVTMVFPLQLSAGDIESTG